MFRYFKTSSLFLGYLKTLFQLHDFYSFEYEYGCEWWIGRNVEGNGCALF